VQVRGRPPVTLELPREATSEAGDLHYRVQLLDDWGAVLDTREGRLVVEEATEPVLEEPGPAPVSRRRTRRSKSVLASPWFWGGALAVVGGAGALAILATSADQQAHFGTVEVVQP
jgi:hypothetical protein